MSQLIQESRMISAIDKSFDTAVLAVKHKPKYTSGEMVEQQIPTILIVTVKIVTINTV